MWEMSIQTHTYTIPSKRRWALNCCFVIIAAGLTKAQHRTGANMCEFFHIENRAVWVSPNLMGREKTSSQNQCLLMLALNTDKAQQSNMKTLSKLASSHLKEDSHGRNYSLLPYGCVKTVKVVWVIHEDLHLCEREREKCENLVSQRSLGNQIVILTLSLTKHTVHYQS